MLPITTNDLAYYMCHVTCVFLDLNPDWCCSQLTPQPRPKALLLIRLLKNSDQSQTFSWIAVQGFKHCLEIPVQTLRKTITKQTTIRSTLCPVCFDVLVVQLCVYHTCCRNLVTEAKFLHLPSCSRSPVPRIGKQWSHSNPSKTHTGHCLSCESPEILSISK